MFLAHLGMRIRIIKIHLLRRRFYLIDRSALATRIDKAGALMVTGNRTKQALQIPSSPPNPLMLMMYHNLFFCKDIWKWFTSSPTVTQRNNVLSSASSGCPPPPSVDPQELPGSTNDSGAIQPKTT